MLDSRPLRRRSSDRGCGRGRRPGRRRRRSPACARPRSRSPSSTRGSGSCSRFAASAISGRRSASAAPPSSPDTQMSSPGLAPRAVERDAGGQLADRGDADRAQRRRASCRRRSARRHAARRARRGRRRTRRASAPPRAGRPMREQRPARRRAHGGEVGEIDGERLVAERAWRRRRQEVTALDQHVGGERELEAGVRPQQRAVVADAEQGPLRCAVEEAVDELEFVQAGLRARATSSGRRRAATFSSTPFTKRWPSRRRSSCRARSLR